MAAPIGFTRMQKLAALATALALTAFASASRAQTAAAYPDKSVRLVVPFAAGGALDVVARIVGQKLTETWGRQIVIDNRLGAGGNIGAEFVAKAPADGYTLLMSSVTTQAISMRASRSMSSPVISQSIQTSRSFILTRVGPRLPYVASRNPFLTERTEARAPPSPSAPLQVTSRAALGRLPDALTRKLGPAGRAAANPGLVRWRGLAAGGDLSGGNCRGAGSAAPGLGPRAWLAGQAPGVKAASGA